MTTTKSTEKTMTTKSNNKIEARYDHNGSLRTDTRGVTTVEYLILLVVIAVAGITIWKKVGTSINAKATKSNSAIQGL